MTMSDTRDGGGPAFPILDMSETQCEGLTIRDWFAGQADPREVYGKHGISKITAERLMGSNVANGEGNDRWWSEANAKWKYQMADAMLKARNEWPTNESPKSERGTVTRMEN
jgi:hypothetical protein